MGLYPSSGEVLPGPQDDLIYIPVPFACSSLRPILHFPSNRT